MNTTYPFRNCGVSIGWMRDFKHWPYFGWPLVSRQAGAFPSGREPLSAEALAEASAKCASLGKTMKLVSTAENPGPYILGNYPKATVIFSCA